MLRSLGLTQPREDFNRSARLAIPEIGASLSLSSSNSVLPPESTPNASTKVLFAIFGLATLLYLLQLWTPLRLTTDGISYLTFADAAAQGDGLASIRQGHFSFPKGYPGFLFFMMRTGVFSSAALVASNLLLLALALVFSYQALTAIGFQKQPAGIGCLLTYLSYATVKHITQAMSDFLFFFLAACSFWLMTRRSWYKWFAVVPGLCAVEVRLLGVALFVPIAFLLWKSAAKRPKVLMPAVGVAACCLAIGIWSGRHYFANNSSLLQYYGLGQFLRLAGATHCEDFGQLIIDLPWTKLPVWTAVFIIGTEAIGLGLFFIGLWEVHKLSPLLSFYLIGCTLLILPWPFTDPRFWMPIMPYGVVVIWQAITHFCARVPKWTVIAYITLFLIAGFGALGYSTWITFSGPKFPDRYGDGGLRNVYAARCTGSPGSDNESALTLLRRYEWRCDPKR